MCGIVFLTYLEAWALLWYLEESDIFVIGILHWSMQWP